MIFSRLTVALLLVAANNAFCQSTSKDYKLVWADEFNKPGLVDSTNWRFEEGFKRNHEDQWYQKENAVCENGLLVITANRVDLPNPDYKVGDSDWRAKRKRIEYTSASLNTAGLHSWKYGRFVMRARVSTADGVWPAFWTLGVKGEWPSNGEIDIMEYYQGMLLANIATGTTKQYSPKWFSVKKPLTSFADPDWSKKFHVWRMDWDESKISLYVDDQLLNCKELKDLPNQDGSGINPFKQPHYILLNLAIGGDNGGNPAATTFPQRYEIDYVRVYQR
ncbi:glycoside hydrolase family 16 protein [Mucilaginibacter achroorhodeus]|uniref:Glycoside hydrolase family 16 protein n=1 Tax=Mucilaginibacter achroorhodeus TaxID=2599294 RepID=A0A563U4H0_9SPHI|nr:glycoside hydrolase family 16 protein [Mucilaginibacter achroorhodeus]TWR26250.1 glycoside hydrolase family 16 protein [Mucilaginibacter achroorhodeus]